MKKVLVCISIISVVLFFSIGCGGPKPEETISNFFNGMKTGNEELFLSSLDFESFKIWKELNCPISAFSGDELIWELEKIEKKNSNNARALVKIINGNEKEFLELGLIKEKNNWKIKGKDIVLKLAYTLTRSCAGNLRNLGIILTVYSTDHKGHYPQNLNVIKDLGYIANLPKCPLCGEDYILKIDSWYSVKFEIFCPCADKHQANKKEVKKVRILKYEAARGVVLK
ncbi:hypothetical protein KAU33_07385 [Candidatus Dependentiae bacterium]|nr:hypothetical protein [Candidatus Dependentiae bacterium]